MIRKIPLWIGLAVLIAAQVGCEPPAPTATQTAADTSTRLPVTQAAQATQPFVTPLSQITPQATSFQNLTPVAQDTATSQDTPLPIFTPTQQPITPSEAASSTAQPEPSPTPLALRTARIEGEPNKIDGTIFWPDTGGAATTGLNFWVEARNPGVGVSDGAGITRIDFVISDRDGQTVYSQTVDKPRFCAFGGGDPDCTTFVFADNNNQWPGTNLPVQNGDFTLTATVNAAGGSQWSGSASFSIQLP